MTLLNSQIITIPEQKAIYETVYDTLSEFSDQLKEIVDFGDAVHIDIKDILEGSCFYYAALGSEVCTKFYQQKFKDPVSDYIVEAGFFALRPYKDKTQELPWFIYRGEISNNQNDYHCWIVGPRKANIKPEIIDFTARHYKAQVDKVPVLTWEREDLENENWIWNNDLDDLKFNEGLIFSSKQDTIAKVRDDKWKNWKYCDLRKRMIDKSNEILSYKLKDLSINVEC
ncbi:MAG: hypothetical protein RLZZ507_3532 [Cyanobacteriota bacterium]|jgi:hypothetical protein